VHVANPQDAASRSAIAMPRESTLTRTGHRERARERPDVKARAPATVDGLMIAAPVFGAARARNATAIALSSRRALCTEICMGVDSEAADCPGANLTACICSLHRLVLATAIIASFQADVTNHLRADRTSMSEKDRRDQRQPLTQGRWRSREELEPLVRQLLGNDALMSQLRGAVGSGDSNKMRGAMYEIVQALAAIDPSAGALEGSRVTVLLAEKLRLGDLGGTEQ